MGHYYQYSKHTIWGMNAKLWRNKNEMLYLIHTENGEWIAALRVEDG